MSTIAAGTANAPLIVYFESTGNAANAGKSDPNVSFVLLNGANATLNLNGHKVSGVGGTVGITGSATVDETLTCSALTLNADAIHLGAATATLNAGSAIIGAGFYAFGTTTDVGATIASTATACGYGAGITSFSATATGPNAVALTWSPTDATKSVLLQRKDGNNWTTLDADATGGTSTAALIASGTTTLRAWDGTAFFVDAANFPASIFYSYRAKVVALRDAEDWSVETRVIMAGTVVYRNESVKLLAQIKKDGAWLTRADVASVRASVFKKSAYSGQTWKEVPHWSAVQVSAESILEAPVGDEDWSTDADDPGPNFVWVPDDSTSPIFPSSGAYVIQVEIATTDGVRRFLTFEAVAK